MIGDVAEVAQHPVAEMQRLARERSVEILHDDRNPAERAVGRTGVGVGAGARVAPVDHRVELRVDRVDARERGVDELAWGGGAVADERSLRGGVEHGEIVHEQDGNATVQVSRTTSAAALSSRSPR